MADVNKNKDVDIHIDDLPEKPLAPEDEAKVGGGVNTNLLPTVGGIGLGNPKATAITYTGENDIDEQ